MKNIGKRSQNDEKKEHFWFKHKFNSVIIALI